MNRKIRRTARASPSPQFLRRTVDPQAALRLLGQARAPEEGQTLDAHIKTRAAFERLRDGGGNTLDFDRLCITLNLCLVRAGQVGNGGTLVQALQKALAAMARMKARYLRGLRLGFDADGLAALPAALDACEALVDASSPLQMKHALREACRRIDEGDVLG